MNKIIMQSATWFDGISELQLVVILKNLRERVCLGLQSDLLNCRRVVCNGSIPQELLTQRACLISRAGAKVRVPQWPSAVRFRTRTEGSLRHTEWQRSHRAEK